MIWIYTCQGPFSRAVVSYLTDKLSTSSFYLVSDHSEAHGIQPISEGIHWLQHRAEEVEFCLFLGPERSIWSPEQQDSVQSYFKQVWRQSVLHDIPFLYLSSYETYAGQDTPWNDNELTLQELNPPTMFGKACHSFDQWVVSQPKKPYFWAGLKLAELYTGESDSIALAASAHVPNLDMIPLISVSHATDILWYFMRSRKTSGLFNVTSTDYLVQSKTMDLKEVRRMDHSCAMNFQKLRNAYPQLSMKSIVPFDQEPKLVIELTS